MPVVLVPTAYRGPTHGKAEIPVEGVTVLACLEAVEADFPGFLGQILDASGAVPRPEGAEFHITGGLGGTTLAPVINGGTV